MAADDISLHCNDNTYIPSRDDADSDQVLKIRLASKRSFTFKISNFHRTQISPLSFIPQTNVGVYRIESIRYDTIRPSHMQSASRSKPDTPISILPDLDGAHALSAANATFLHKAVVNWVRKCMSPAGLWIKSAESDLVCFVIALHWLQDDSA